VLTDDPGQPFYELATEVAFVVHYREPSEHRGIAPGTVEVAARFRRKTRHGIVTFKKRDMDRVGHDQLPALAKGAEWGRSDNFVCFKELSTFLDEERDDDFVELLREHAPHHAWLQAHLAGCEGLIDRGAVGCQINVVLLFVWRDRRASLGLTTTW